MIQPLLPDYIVMDPLDLPRMAWHPKKILKCSPPGFLYVRVSHPRVFTNSPRLVGLCGGGVLGAAPHQNWKTKREVLESLDKMLRVKFCTFFLVICLIAALVVLCLNACI